MSRRRELARAPGVRSRGRVGRVLGVVVATAALGACGADGPSPATAPSAARSSGTSPGPATSSGRATPATSTAGAPSSSTGSSADSSAAGSAAADTEPVVRLELRTGPDGRVSVSFDYPHAPYLLLPDAKPASYAEIVGIALARFDSVMPRVVVAAGPNTPHATLVALLDGLRKAGVTAVSLTPERAP
ncbi:MAG: hypothetical protein HY908_27960 [Myxococcales bacterium]|nr:hypothetical protein [Myxococcales bacterium]